MTPRRLLLRLTALALVVAGLTGCVAIKTETSSTRLPGVVTLNVSICGSQREDGSACIPDTGDGTLRPNTAEGDSGPDALTNTTGLVGQILVGFRVPEGTTAPDQFVSPDGEAFTRSASYSADLAADRSAPAGFQWIGYTSSSIAPAAGASLTHFSVELGLPAGPGGAPFAGPFRWRVIAGVRLVNGNAGAPVVCDAHSDCYDSPPASALFTHLTQAVSDFRVLPGAGATAAPGQSATVSFPVRYTDGAGFGPQTLALSASSGLPGAAPPSVPATLAIAPGASPSVAATVTVPPGTPPGTYPVTLAAADGTPDPVTRSNTATVTVVDRTAPAIAIGSPTDGEQLTAGQQIAAAYSCADEPGGSGLATCAGPVPVGAPLDTATTGTKTFTVTATDRAGNAASLTRTYTVVAPPLPTINASVTFAFAGARKGLRFTSLVVKDIPPGATVTAKSRGRHFTRRNASRTVVLKPFLHRTLRRGTVLTVTITKPGTIGRVRPLTIGRKAVKVATTCLPPGAKKPSRCV
jgi:hypothetical protein